MSRRTSILLGALLCTVTVLAVGCSPAADGSPTAAAPATRRSAATLSPSPTQQPTATLPPTTVPTQPSSAAPPGTAVALTILHTNDSRGFVDPCG